MPNTLALLACLLALATAAAAYNNGVGKLPVMGWNTWCSTTPKQMRELGVDAPDLCGLTDNCNAQELMDAADALVASGMRDLGYTLVAADDCWSAFNRTADGNLYALPSEFPDGIEAVADYVHERGLLLGLYLCIGTETCRRGRPGSYGHYEQDANFLSNFVDAVKIDNCNRPANTTELELYSAFSAAFNATGKPVIVMLCEWGDANSEPYEPVEQWGPTIAHSYRVQMDHLPLWSLPTKGAGAGYGQGTKQVIEYMAYLTAPPRSFSSVEYGMMDPDFLETLFFPTMSFIDSRTEFSFWTLFSAPLIVATNVYDIMSDPAKKTILMNADAIAIDQDPLLKTGHRVANNSDGTQVWMKPLANGDLALICFNSHDLLPLRCSISWAQLGLPSTASLALRDIWQQKDLGSFTGGYDVPLLLPHDVVYLRATPQ